MLQRAMLLSLQDDDEELFSTPSFFSLVGLDVNGHSETNGNTQDHQDQDPETAERLNKPLSQMTEEELIKLAIEASLSDKTNEE